MLSLGWEELKTGSPISLLDIHCELDDKVVALPPGGTQTVRMADTARHKKKESRIRSTEVAFSVG